MYVDIFIIRIYAHKKRPIAHMRPYYQHMRGNSSFTATEILYHVRPEWFQLGPNKKKVGEEETDLS